MQQAKKKTGKVWIAGAGPGDAGLLTIKVKNMMERADVIVYDALVSAEILSLIPAEKEMIFVGKRLGHHHVPQHEINRILVREAKKGKRVLRLKGGDPFVFGRGGEEIEVLAAENIPFEVIPGITSAVAAPAYAGIPVTHRDYVSSFHVITGHPRQDGSSRIDFDSLVNLKGTLVFLMGITSLGTICRGLLEAGMSPQMPAAIVEKGTMAGQRRIVSVLEKLERDAKEAEVSMPALILVGEVCGLSDKMEWSEIRPLGGRQILVTRPKENGHELAERLRELGAQVIEMPAIATVPIVPNSRLREAVDKLGTHSSEEWLVFTSPIGVKVFFERIREWKIDIRTLFCRKAVIKIATIGSGTAKRLEQYGLLADLVPEVYCAGKLGEAIAETAAEGSYITVVRAADGSKELIPPMEEKGLEAEDVPLYETRYEVRGELTDKVRDLFAAREIDAVTFTSASTVRGFVNAMSCRAYLSEGGKGADEAGQRMETEELYAKGCQTQNVWQDVPAVCIGEQTAAEAKKYGMSTVIADEAAIESLVETVVMFFDKNIG